MLCKHNTHRIQSTEEFSPSILWTVDLFLVTWCSILRQPCQHWGQGTVTEQLYLLSQTSSYRKWLLPKSSINVLGAFLFNDLGHNSMCSHGVWNVLKALWQESLGLCPRDDITHSRCQHYRQPHSQRWPFSRWPARSVRRAEAGPNTLYAMKSAQQSGDSLWIVTTQWKLENKYLKVFTGVSKWFYACSFNSRKK